VHQTHITQIHGHTFNNSQKHLFTEKLKLESKSNTCVYLLKCFFVPQLNWERLKELRSKSILLTCPYFRRHFVIFSVELWLINVTQW